MFYFSNKAKAIAKAEKAHQMGQIEKAIDIISELELKHADDYQVRIHKIWFLTEGERNDDALALIEKEVETRPNDPVLHMLRGECYLKQSQLKEAESALLTSLKISPDNLRSSYALAKVYIGQKKYERASELLEEVARYNKSFVQGRLLLMSEIIIQESAIK